MECSKLNISSQQEEMWRTEGNIEKQINSSSPPGQVQPWHSQCKVLYRSTENYYQYLGWNNQMENPTTENLIGLF